MIARYKPGRNVTTLPWTPQASLAIPITATPYRLIALLIPITTVGAGNSRVPCLTFTMGRVAPIIRVFGAGIAGDASAVVTFAPNLPAQSANTGTVLLYTAPLPVGLVITPDISIALDIFSWAAGDLADGPVSLVREFLAVPGEKPDK